MSKYNRLGKNTVTVFVGNIGSKLITLLMLPLYTQWLSVEDYGLTDIVSMYVSLLSAFVTCSIAESVFIFPKGQPVEDQKRYFSTGLFFSIGMLLVTALVFFVLGFIDISNSFGDNLWLIYGMLATSVLQNYVQQFVRSIDKMMVYSVTGIVLTIATALFSFVFIPRYGVLGFVLAMISANVLSMIYSLVFSKANLFVSLKAINKDKWMEMLRYSLPLIPNSLIWWLIGSLNRPIMEANIGMEQVGFFAVANKFPTIIVTVYNVFFYSWQVSVIEEFSTKDYEKFYNKIFKLLLFIVVVLSCLLSICSPLVISLMTSADFHEAWIYVPVLSLAPIFHAISSYAGANFSATRESKYFFYSGAIGAIISLVLNSLLIPRIGIWGAIITVVISFWAMAMSRVYFSRRHVRILQPLNVMLTIGVGIAVSLSMTLLSDSVYKYLLSFSLFVLLILVNKTLLTELVGKLKALISNRKTT